ncbi:uncharacterized protein EV420DRAFT_826072 [Desarmillaria tabescens]|uniref:F-box domain-containing protein n=1 Tax=Armillaria tabescens TaxID=1929756 RepID=A0AA39TXX7_ARMTA|nr:uncharacterized protein EV420DRAFT_826072 [Desarmillaria tabescens]KAK0466364.1 hypothetical protein EV420DRAFT_826072 [Desarmillaria tabescens]
MHRRRPARPQNRLVWQHPGRPNDLPFLHYRLILPLRTDVYQHLLERALSKYWRHHHPSLATPTSPTPNGGRAPTGGGIPRPRATPSIVSTKRSLVRTIYAPSSTSPQARVTNETSTSTTTPPRAQLSPLATPPSRTRKTPAFSPEQSLSPSSHLTSPTPQTTPRSLLDRPPSTPKATPSRSMLGHSPLSKSSTPNSTHRSPIVLSTPILEQPKLLSQSAALLSLTENSTSYGSPENHFFSTSAVIPSSWAIDDDNATLDMITEDGDEHEGDEELAGLLSQISTLHSRKITSYKRLLERAQLSSAAQLHALQAEIQVLKEQLQNGRGHAHNPVPMISGEGLCRQCRRKKGYWDGYRGVEDDEDDEGVEDDLAVILKGKGKSNFDENAVRRIVRHMGREARGRLIGIILEACHPGDIPLQILLLQRYLKSTYDVLGNLSPELSLRILKEFSVSQMLGLTTVSKKWYATVHHPSVWRYHCLRVTVNDPVPLKWPDDDAGWFPLYRSLHHLHSNLANALPQSILFLNGHTNFVTTLILKGRRLVSGSYDETIRFWELPERGVGVGMNAAATSVSGGSQVDVAGLAQCKKVLRVGKVVSCIDWLIEEEVFVVGFHDVGRVHLFSSLTYTPLQQLAGHLNGIRAVALSSKNLVSAGADKALVCWDWRAGTKIVRFGQQTTINIGVQIIAGSTSNEGERVVSVTIDGVVRVFSIQRREMMSQFKLSDLGGTDPVLNAKLHNVGAAPNNMLQWFAAKGTQMTCATKSIIMHLQWQEESEDASTKPTPTSSKLMGPPSPKVTSPISLSTSLNTVPAAPRARTVSSLARSTSSVISSSQSSSRRTSLIASVSSVSTAKSRLSMNSTTRARTPSTSISPTSTRTGTPAGLFPIRFGRAAILTAPPKLVAMVETPDVAMGAVDPRKKRVVTATRFSSRAGADRRMFMSIHEDAKEQPHAGNDSLEADADLDLVLGISSRNSSPSVDIDTTVTPVTGAWAALANADNATGVGVKGLIGPLPPKFQGLATPEKNPMSMQLSHEEVVIGCADGTIYVMNFVGYEYQKPRQRPETVEVSVDDVDDESISASDQSSGI